MISNQSKIKAKNSQDDDCPLMVSKKSLYLILDLPNVVQDAVDFFVALG